MVDGDEADAGCCWYSDGMPCLEGMREIIAA